ncbi:MAG TPA: hypothetical protein VFK87_03640, partial [Steroidobacteraceae bacterium]|nr:hypothetical protein [Steroidobacteraceae bacterium]
HPAGTAGGQAVPAHWKSVDLLASREPLDAAADCDLIGQIRRKVLPLFAIRSLEFHAACARGQVVIASTRLKTQVLAPDPSTAAAASASR